MKGKFDEKTSRVSLRKNAKKKLNIKIKINKLFLYIIFIVSFTYLNLFI